MRGTTAALVVLSMLAFPSLSSAGDVKLAVAKIQVSFKLDPRLAGPTYGGDRWVSPPTYTGASAQNTVEAMARAVDAGGRPTKASVEWTSSDPDMVTASPPRGEQVKITVRRAGKSSLTVVSGGASRNLTVEAAQTKGVWHLSISQ